jgi:hypothetical protein
MKVGLGEGEVRKKLVPLQYHQEVALLRRGHVRRITKHGCLEEAYWSGCRGRRRDVGGRFWDMIVGYYFEYCFAFDLFGFGGVL